MLEWCWSGAGVMLGVGVLLVSGDQRRKVAETSGVAPGRLCEARLVGRAKLWSSDQ